MSGDRGANPRVSNGTENCCKNKYQAVHLFRVNSIPSLMILVIGVFIIYVYK